jgi:choline dehydrogenase-like flavoprotein
MELTGCRLVARNAGGSTIHIDLDQTSSQTVSSTICIVGAGIAGLTLASRLAASNITVHLLEAGGLELEDRSQALYATEQPADVHLGAHEGRFRVFGGSSTRWGAQLLPFPEDIFTPPPGSPSRPWPITESDLLPYYEEIQKMFDTDLLPFDATLLPALGHPVAVVQWRVNQVEQDSAIRFAALIRVELTSLGIAPSTWDESIDGHTPFG